MRTGLGLLIRVTSVLAMIREPTRFTPTFRDVCRELPLLRSHALESLHTLAASMVRARLGPLRILNRLPICREGCTRLERKRSSRIIVRVRAREGIGRLSAGDGKLAP